MKRWGMLVGAAMLIVACDENPERALMLDDGPEHLAILDQAVVRALKNMTTDARSSRTTNSSGTGPSRSASRMVIYGYRRPSESTTAPNGDKFEYRSGMVTTGPPAYREPAKFAFLYGTVAARLRVPEGAGLWSGPMAACRQTADPGRRSISWRSSVNDLAS